ncbi:MAG: transglutaminase family protein [Sphingomonadales bacterium]|nr:transglutaminase family protein [Sphingomonadales bacterium]
MRLTIDHRTRYQFSEPQARVVQLLRMTPLDFGGQTVIDWRIDVDCDARLREGRDGYGNITTMLYIDGPINAVSIMVRGDVLTDDLGGRVKGTLEPLPPLFFMRSTPLTETSEAISDLVPSTPTGLDQAMALNLAVKAAVSVEPGRTPKTRTAAEVLAEGQGSVRDCTHVLLAAARSAGYPARLVSGHCLDGPNARSHKSAHCWAELFIAGEGWIAFDPSTGRLPGDTYVRVAVGLDAGDSTPLSGTRRGGGIEELDVEVRIAMSQSQE